MVTGPAKGRSGYPEGCAAARATGNGSDSFRLHYFCLFISSDKLLTSKHRAFESGTSVVDTVLGDKLGQGPCALPKYDYFVRNANYDRQKIGYIVAHFSNPCILSVSHKCYSLNVSATSITSLYKYCYLTVTPLYIFS